LSGSLRGDVPSDRPTECTKLRGSVLWSEHVWSYQTVCKSLSDNSRRALNSAPRELGAPGGLMTPDVPKVRPLVAVMRRRWPRSSAPSFREQMRNRNFLSKKSSVAARFQRRDQHSQLLPGGGSRRTAARSLAARRSCLLTRTISTLF
jgi:hypothetical protein